MNDDSHEPIIDALLDEVLGGQEPPDLTQKILRQLRENSLSGDVGADEDDSEVVIEVSGRRKPKPAKRSTNRFQIWLSVAIVFVGVCLFGTWTVLFNINLIKRNPKPILPPEPPEDAIVEEKPDSYVPLDPESEQVPILEQHPWLDPSHLRGILHPERVAENTPEPEVASPETPTYQRRFSLRRRWSDARVVDFINDELEKGWARAKFNVADGIGDLAWFDRATETLLGRKATDDERQAFERSRDKESALERLFTHEDFVSNWAAQFTDVLVGGSSNNQFDRQSLEAYVADAIRSKTSFDELTFELLTAQGTNEVNAKSHNPAVNFLLAHVRPDSAGKRLTSIVTPATDRVCQVFLGQQMLCARCHDHPSTQLAQQRYWELASFFAQTRVVPQQPGLMLLNRDFGGSNGRSFDEADLFFDDNEAIGATAYPVNLQGESISRSGRVSDIDRRVALAHSIVASDQFAQATVNRIWKFVFQSGFTRPVDDMGEHNPVSHDRLLTRLATEFRNSEFDLRSTLTWMVMCRAFDRKLSPERGTTPLFSTFARRRSVSYPRIDAAIGQLATASKNGVRFDPTKHLAQTATGDAEQLTKQQKHDELRRVASYFRDRLLTTKPGSLLVRLARDQQLSDQQRVDHLFYATVGRAPTQREQKHGVSVLQNTSSRTAALQRLGWILVNSQEFKTLH